MADLVVVAPNQITLITQGVARITEDGQQRFTEDTQLRLAE